MNMQGGQKTRLELWKPYNLHHKYLYIDILKSYSDINNADTNVLILFIT